MPLPVETQTRDESVTERPTLAAFLRANHDDLLARCRAKVAQRHAPEAPPAALSSGVARFLRQLEEVLESERPAAGNERAAQAVTTSSGIGPAAAVHGVALLERGLTVDQVVHEYGDVCQAVTELALTQGITFFTDDFRILNRCLDDAIAAAVTAYQDVAQQSVVDEHASLHRRLHTLIYDHQRLVGIARQSFLAIKSGHVGVPGATGMLLAHALEELSEERLSRALDAFRQAAA